MNDYINLLDENNKLKEKNENLINNAQNMNRKK